MRIRARVRIVDSKQQRGFSLPETLIAAVIAAGVVAAAATSIGASARLSAATAARDERLSEARTIVARVKAGMPDDAALHGFDGWRLQRRPVPPLRETEAPIFDAVALTTGDEDGWRVEFWAPAARGGAL